MNYLTKNVNNIYLNVVFVLFKKWAQNITRPSYKKFLEIKVKKKKIIKKKTDRLGYMKSTF